MFTDFVTCETDQICFGCVCCFDCSSSSLKYDVSYFFCLKAIVINKYDMFYITQVRVFFFVCTRNESYTFLSFVFCACICWQGNMVEACITILYVNSTTEETWWSLQLGVGKKNIHIHQYWYGLSAKWVVKYRIWAKNPISCIPSLYEK